MPNQDATNKSIISFRVKVEERYLDYDQLKTVFEEIIKAAHDDLPGQYRKIFFGQPVRYGDRSFIRLALGAYDIRQLLHSENKFKIDKKIIDIIEKTQKVYVVKKSSGRIRRGLSLAVRQKLITEDDSSVIFFNLIYSTTD